MHFHGDINLQNNEMQQLAMGLENDFPIEPIVGRVVFKNQTLYICVDLNGILPIWVPITNSISMYKEDITATSNVLVIAHDLSTSNPIVQIYDSNDQLIIPDSIIANGLNQLTITLGIATIGKVIVLKGDEMPANGATILTPDRYSYVIDFINESTIVVKHNLGYYPIVRAFIGNSEILPSNVIHDSVFQSTISFSSLQTGTLRFI